MEQLLTFFNTGRFVVQSGVSQAVSVGTVLGFLFSIIFIAIIIYYLIMTYFLRERSENIFFNHFVRPQETTMSARPNPRREHWKQVSHAMTSPDPLTWRAALIDADTMLDEAVTEQGYIGETFGERLKSISRRDAPWIDAAWEVHRLRNILAHEGSRYPLNHREAYRAYKIYDNLLHTLGYFG